VSKIKTEEDRLKNNRHAEEQEALASHLSGRRKLASTWNWVADLANAAAERPWAQNPNCAMAAIEARA
jgi:hypothetical protein